MLIAAQRPRNSFGMAVDASAPVYCAPMQCIVARQKENGRKGFDARWISVKIIITLVAVGIQDFLFVFLFFLLNIVESMTSL